MAIDPILADSVRAILSDLGQQPREQKMFGGLAFMVAGNMAVGVSDHGLLVRVGEARHDEALTREGASVMVMRNREMRGWIRVEPAPREPAELAEWVQMGVENALTQPPKTARARKASQAAAVNPRQHPSSMRRH